MALKIAMTEDFTELTCCAIEIFKIISFEPCKPVPFSGGASLVEKIE
jgi:hypothetical protein